jgi:2-methylaconitate isomerase
MGLAERPEAVSLANPKIAMIASPKSYNAIDGRSVAVEDYDIGVRMVSMERVHRAVTLTAAMCVATACQIEGTLPAKLSSSSARDVRVGSPSGVLPVAAEVVEDDGWSVRRAIAFRTARCLMRGDVSVRGA